MKIEKPIQAGRSNDALLEAVTLFCLLAVAALGVLWFYNVQSLSEELTRSVIALLLLLVCILVAKSVYDRRRTDSFVFESGGDRSKEIIATVNSDLFQQVYHNSPVPYVLIDQIGTVTSANKAALRLFRKPQDALVGLDIFQYFQVANMSHVQFMAQKLQAGIPVNGEEMMIYLGETEPVAWVLVSVYPYTNAFGQSVGLMTLVDITKQKQVENAKAEFVSLASHQLRTPIAGIRWSAELLLMDNPDVLSHRQKKYIGRMLESVDRMSVLIDDFLRVSRFELGTFVAEITTVSVPGLIAEILTDQAAVIRKKELQVTTKTDAVLEQMTADPNLLRMVVTNLLTNAIKYTPHGGTILIQGEVIGDSFQFEVRDSGMGIPVDDQPQIFQKLFRASNATREVPDGTGLGLYIVREAVRVMGGRISFVSAEGSGTTFTVVLPFEQASS